MNNPTIYLFVDQKGWTAFELNSDECNAQLLLNKIIIGYGAKIGYGANIGDRANIGYGANIGDRANIGYRANIGH